MKAVMVLSLAFVLADAGAAHAVTCFSKGERTEGRYKVCYYDCLGDTVAITIKAVHLCPLTIRQE